MSRRIASVWPAYGQRMASKLSQNAGNTLGIRQSYASCTLNTLLNRQVYAKMYIIVADTSDIR